ncbi:M48 family metallopeptidase [Erwiniaceae bacterium BAC15a-03b]|uniref:M48 family metallopeptidase n=1 Tax=Winslowiella arboricola TaxID=2978220 RepID=A0A9J6PIG4_9GAMM|nr:M48 family metallopeptidase [Winslowiella arboricola]MCU5771286.1 M48 family metallopeptidase [Winslowiella arboricola]MCU5776267.1 M48 family metallopeptidase [Winslowiella arboricola]
MNELKALKKGYAKVFLWLLVTLFLIPTITLVFSEYGSRQLDQQYSEIFVNDAIAQNQDVNRLNDFLRQNPPSSVCGAVPDELRDYQHAVCAEQSELWQFYMMDKVSFWTLIAGAVILLLVLLFSALAFTSRKGQLLSLTLARQFLMLASALEVLVQGAMLVWLSFWSTAFFTQTYYPKVILLVGMLVLYGMYHMIKGIFKKLPKEDGVEGEVVTREAAPELWARVDALAAQVGTTPPDHIIAGIDVNFYVTEAPLSVNEQPLHGRKLYVSIPLLRQLDTAQADGVMVHELTHLHEGDTASGALLGPKLHRFDQYTQLMSENLATLVVFYPLCLYRMLFELASQRDSRQREFIADRTAATLISPAAIIESLIKISAYASYRGEVEQTLFDNKTLLANELGIRKAIAAGLPEHVHSPDFIGLMRQQNIPHPFDSHPPLADRMRNVGYTVEETHYAAIAASFPAQSWADLMPVATEIEQRLWQKYERDFSSAHEESLAWRYEPVSEEETALVLKYFPPVTYSLKGGLQVAISYRGIVPPQSAELLEWDNIKSVNHVRRFGTDIIYLQHHQPNALGKKRSKIALPGIKKEIEAFNQTFGLYWNRHQSMRALQEQERNVAIPS